MPHIGRYQGHIYIVCVQCIHYRRAFFCMVTLSYNNINQVILTSLLASVYTSACGKSLDAAVIIFSQYHMHLIYYSLHHYVHRLALILTNQHQFRMF